jgi:hypothetical protein
MGRRLKGFRSRYRKREDCIKQRGTVPSSSLSYRLTVTEGDERREHAIRHRESFVDGICWSKYDIHTTFRMSRIGHHVWVTKIYCNL